MNKRSIAMVLSLLAIALASGILALSHFLSATKTKADPDQPEALQAFMRITPAGLSASTLECIARQELIGTWKDVESPRYTLELNFDGTFAERHDGIVAVFREDRKTPTYDVLATTTGVWSIVTNRSKEIENWNKDYPDLPPLYLPDDGTIIREEFGGGPWYFKLQMQENCQTLTMTATWMDYDPGYKYRKAL